MTIYTKISSRGRFDFGVCLLWNFLRPASKIQPFFGRQSCYVRMFSKINDNDAKFKDTFNLHNIITTKPTKDSAHQIFVSSIPSPQPPRSHKVIFLSFYFNPSLKNVDSNYERYNERFSFSLKGQTATTVQRKIQEMCHLILYSLSYFIHVDLQKERHKQPSYTMWLALLLIEKEKKKYPSWNREIEMKGNVILYYYYAYTKKHLFTRFMLKYNFEGTDFWIVTKRRSSCTGSRNIIVQGESKPTHVYAFFLQKCMYRQVYTTYIFNPCGTKNEYILNYYIFLLEICINRTCAFFFYLDGVPSYSIDARFRYFTTVSHRFLTYVVMRMS